jgi:hypothetical protein
MIILSFFEISHVSTNKNEHNAYRLFTSKINGLPTSASTASLGGFDALMPILSDGCAHLEG